MATLTLQAAPAVAGQLPDMLIEPSWIKEGNPVARGTILTQSDDKRVSSGLWSCEPGKFEWTFSWDEFVHLLEGEVEITEDGTDNTVTLGPGDMAHFPLGMKTHWHVRKAVRKFFVIRTPEPFEL
ncbi:MAG: cupin domain-containing protein [Pirellulaceae bacterium]